MSIPTSNWEDNWESHGVLQDRKETAADLQKEIDKMKEQIATLEYDLQEKESDLSYLEASIYDLESTL
jgi:septal ring factor EnvC (AmiA/AmiB activator)